MKIMMSKKFPMLLTSTEFRMDKFEAYLDDTIIPVSPREEFVAGLRQKLVKSKSRSTNRRKILQYGVLGTAGVLSSLILVATSIKATITLIGAIRILRNSVQSEQAVT
jgi:hypothetical protein